MNTEQALSLSEAAHVLNCSADTVRRLLDSGRLKGERTIYGRTVDAQDLQRLLREREQHG